MYRKSDACSRVQLPTPPACEGESVVVRIEGVLDALNAFDTGRCLEAFLVEQAA